VYPSELAVAVPVGLGPLHPQRADQLPLQRRPVDRVGGAAVPVDVPSVATNMLRPAVATAGAELPVQVGGRLRQPGVVGGQHRPAGRRIPEPVEDRDALGRAQHQVKAGDRVTAVLAAQQLPGLRVAALDQPPEALLGGFPLQAEAGGAVAVPAAWGLAVAGQVLLAVVGEAFQVVVLAARRQLGHVQHHPSPTSRAPRCASECTPGALLSSDDYGSSVERAAKLHPLCAWS
jgi:hypothetical protein